MRKILLVTMLLTIMGGVSSVKAERVYASPANGTQTWTSGTNTFSWTATSNNYIATGLPTGDISLYTNFHCTVSNFSDNANFIRLVLKNGKDEQITEKIYAGDFNVNLVAKYPKWDFTQVTDFLIFGSYSATEDHVIDAEHPASVVITNIYLERPNEFIWDETGKASINKTGLTASGGLTYDPSTGALSSDGTAGSLALEFATPVDMRNLFQFNVANSGSTGDILSRLEFYDEDDTKINTWNGIKLGNKGWAQGIDDHATNAFLNHKPVKKMVWPSDANASNNGKTATISSVAFTCKTIACAKAGETQLKTLPYQNMSGETNTPTWNVLTSTDTYYGTSDGTNAVSYTDITEYSELRIYRDNNLGFRAFFIDAAGSKVNTINHENAASTWNAEGKYWSIDLSRVEKYEGKVALQSIKSQGWGQNNIVKNIVVYNAPAANAPQYILTGSGFQLAETEAALADATATAIDATGVTGITTNSEAGRTLLTSANPNCLFLGTTGNGGLANTQNVITSGTCANLVLTDNYPFKTPAAFTATAVSYNRSFTADNMTTVCLPFALTSDEASDLGTFYELSSVDGTVITFSEVAEPAANTPYLVIPTGTPLSIGGKSIAATPAETKSSASNIEFIGTLAATGIPASEEPNNYYAFNNGVLVRIAENSATLPAFRAYIKATEVGGGVKAFTIQFDDATGVNSLPSMDVAASSKFNVQSSKIYNVAGQRMSKLQKGLNIVNGKKVMVK